MSSLLLLSTLLTLAAASPLPSPASALSKRTITTGAKAGLGIGIAVAALLLIGLLCFFIFHFRRQSHLKKLNTERAILAGEKNADGSDKTDKFAPVPANAGLKPPPSNLKRNKSVKDRLMGPLYRGSTIELPVRRVDDDGNPRDSVGPDAHWSDVDGQPLVHKPWAESSPRPSFSSKRATRMMMMM